MKTLFSMALATLFTFALFAQKSEIGLSLDGWNYQGDVSGTPAPNLSETNIGVGAFYRYNFHSNFAVKGMFQFGRISGDDRETEFSNVDPLVDFSSTLVNVGAALEYNILSREVQKKYYDGNGQEISREDLKSGNYGKLYDAKGNEVTSTPTLERKLIPYITLGAAVSFFSPEVNYAGTSDVRYGDDSQTNTLFFPVGVGVKYYMNDDWLLGLEVMTAPTLTDYIDGVSRRTDTNDWLSAISLYVAYQF